MNRENTGTDLLITATLAGYGLELIGGEAVLNVCALWPFDAGFMPWQLVSYAFLHAGLAHLVFNMPGLWRFGRELEKVLGRRALLQLFFAGSLSAGVVQLLVTMLTGLTYPTLGASGGVFGLLLGFAIFYPNRIVLLIFPPIPMPAWLFAIVYAVIELSLGVTGAQAGVAHFAHLGGMAGGYFFIRLWLRRCPMD